MTCVQPKEEGPFQSLTSQETRQQCASLSGDYRVAGGVLTN